MRRRQLGRWLGWPLVGPVVLVRRRAAVAGRPLGPGPDPPRAAAAGHHRAARWSTASPASCWPRPGARSWPPSTRPDRRPATTRSTAAPRSPNICPATASTSSAGRCWAARSAIPRPALALASLVETALLVALAAGLALPLARARLGAWSLALPAGALAALALFLVAPRLLPAGLLAGPAGHGQRVGRLPAGNLLRAMALQAAFFARRGRHPLAAGGAAGRPRAGRARPADQHLGAGARLGRGLRRARRGGRHRHPRGGPDHRARRRPRRRGERRGRAGPAPGDDRRRRRLLRARAGAASAARPSRRVAAAKVKTKYSYSLHLISIKVNITIKSTGRPVYLLLRYIRQSHPMSRP